MQYNKHWKFLIVLLTIFAFAMVFSVVASAGAGDERRDDRVTGLGAAFSAEDVIRIELVVSYSEPTRYAITGSVPIRMLIDEMKNPTEPFDVDARAANNGPACAITVFCDTEDAESPVNVPVLLSKNMVVEALGDPPVAPSERLQWLLPIFLRRLDNSEGAASDETIPGGFLNAEVMYPELAKDTQGVLLVLDSIAEGYRQKSDLTPEEKVEWLWAATYRAGFSGSEKTMKRSAKAVEDFIAHTKNDTETSPHYGGLAYGTMVEIRARYSLSRLYERAKQYRKSLEALNKLQALLAEDVLSAATNAPTDAHPGTWEPASLRAHLEWWKNTAIPKAIARCERKLQEQED